MWKRKYNNIFSPLKLGFPRTERVCVWVGGGSKLWNYGTISTKRQN